jgi:dihydropteroate synthase
MAMLWKLKNRTIDLTQRGMIMGVLNVTPDSFSDGGRFVDQAAATMHALEMEAEGADIIDIGGESTRPGAAEVSEEDELRRVVPVIRAIRERSQILISIDTSKAAVADAALEAGADIVNDVTAFLGDPAMAGVAARHRAGAVLMHMQGTPRTMQHSPQYDDVVADVANFLRQRMAATLDCGMAVESLVLDPGIGFGKRLEHNCALLAGVAELARIGPPLLIGVSRKSFLGLMTGSKEMADRFWPGVALTSLCRERGARIFRVHDVKPHREALRMTEAIIGHA